MMRTAISPRFAIIMVFRDAIAADRWGFERAGRVTSVAIERIVIVAFLACIQGAVTAFQKAAGIASIAIIRISVVAALADFLYTVAALQGGWAFALTGARAAVPIGHVAVITLFDQAGIFQQAVSAHRAIGIF